MHLLTGQSSGMTVVPWELEGAPCELHQKEMDVFGGPPQQQGKRKRAGREKGKQPATSIGTKIALESINESPQHAQIREDAATSMTDLARQGLGLEQGKEMEKRPGVHNAQINALAKMLYALRR